ncbi:hypothetical protein CHH80_22815 [Bacillus sp. 7504-2]|nr:hypothetical protein CHH80_22815 [Bacillus sp. 7504-2]
MYLSYQTYEHPFMFSYADFLDTVFLDHAIKSDVYYSNNLTIRGSALSFSRKTLIQRATGEFIERLSLFEGKSITEGRAQASFRLLTGDVLEISKDEIFLERTSKQYNDSSGVATHYDSFNAIKNAFFEYLERQAFVFSWVHQIKGKIIDPGSLSKQNLNLKEKAFLYIDNLYIIDISLSKYVHVILIFGHGDVHKGIGLSAGVSFQRVVSKAFDEFFQSIAYMNNKHILKKINYYPHLIYNQKEKEDSHYYSLSPEEFSREMEFFQKETKISENFLEQELTQDSFNKLLKSIEKELDTFFYCTFLPLRINTNLKVARVFTLDLYTKLRVDLYENKEKSDYLNKMKLERVKQNRRPLPFP